MSQLTTQIQCLTEEMLEDLGFELVKVNIRSNNPLILELLVDRKNGESLTIKDCRSISTSVSAILDVEDLIKDKYYLEVSSPGLERPLIKFSDYQRFAQRPARVRLRSQIEGSSHYKGLISGVDERANKISLTIEGGKVIEIAFDHIKSGHLVITDEMFQKMMKRPADKVK